MEIGVGLTFVLSYVLWPLPLSGASNVAVFLLWLVAVVMLAILFAYDLKWFLLPDSIVVPLIGVGAVMSMLRVVTSESIGTALISVVIAGAVLSGLYFGLWYFSKGQWVGFGDVKLGLGLALLLADWRLALLALFAANLFGTIAVLPGMITGKLHRKAQVPFGPLLIAGTIVSMVVGERIIDFYLSLTF